MIKQGWAHDDLMAMTVDEFAYWFRQTMEFAEAEARVIRDAGERAKQSRPAPKRGRRR